MADAAFGYGAPIGHEMDDVEVRAVSTTAGVAARVDMGDERNERTGDDPVRGSPPV